MDIPAVQRLRELESTLSIHEVEREDRNEAPAFEEEREKSIVAST